MISRRAAMAGMAASALARPSLAQSGPAALTDLARRAAIFATPIHETYRRRWRETVDPANPRLLKLNQLDHGAAGPHALHSVAWLDLAAEPIFLTLPDMEARGYCFAVVDMFGDTIDQVSRRRYGRRALPHVLFGPSWTNPPPSGVRAVHATTNLVRLTGRIAIDDLAAARASQAKVLLETPATRNERRVLESRELMPAGSVVPDEPVASWPEPRADDPWDLFVVAARVLGEGPVPERDAALVQDFAALRLRPRRRFDLLGFSPKERAAMLEGIEAAHAEIGDAAARAIRRVGAWRYPPLHPGDFGEDRLQRAAVATIDPFMPETAEAMTLLADTDDSGAPLDGARRYVLRFSADGPPPTRASWSITAGGELITGLEVPPRAAPGKFAIAMHVWEPVGSLIDRAWRPPGIFPIQ